MVYVKSITGQPLMPTKRHGFVRRLLKTHRAKVIQRCPFTIQLRRGVHGNHAEDPDRKASQRTPGACVGNVRIHNQVHAGKIRNSQDPYQRRPLHYWHDGSGSLRYDLPGEACKMPQSANTQGQDSKRWNQKTQSGTIHCIRFQTLGQGKVRRQGMLRKRQAHIGMLCTGYVGRRKSHRFGLLQEAQISGNCKTLHIRKERWLSSHD